MEITAENLDDVSIKDSYLKCKECNGKLEHKTKYQWLESGIWVPAHADREIRGFYINQLYSSTVTPVDLAKSYVRSLYNPADEQEFYNSKLGLAHTVDGAQITDTMISNCLRSYRQGDKHEGRIRTMGIDVGKWLHYEIAEWIIPKDTSTDINLLSRPRIVEMGKVQTFDELEHKMREYRIQFCVVDANPERRKAYEFATKFWGHVRLCFYGRGIQGKQINISKDVVEPSLTVDRTSWLDLSLGRFRTGNIDLPIDTHEEYKQNLKSLVRRYEKDSEGNPVGRYVKSEKDDHFAHARNYSEIALPFAVSLYTNTNIIGDIL